MYSIAMFSTEGSTPFPHPSRNMESAKNEEKAIMFFIGHVFLTLEWCGWNKWNRNLISPMRCALTDRLSINRDAALIIFNMHKTKQVHAENQINKYKSYRYYKLNSENENPPHAMLNVPKLNRSAWAPGYAKQLSTYYQWLKHSDRYSQYAPNEIDCCAWGALFEFPSPTFQERCHFWKRNSTLYIHVDERK